MKTVKLKSHFFIFIFLAFYFFFSAKKLISLPLPFYDWDESIYMEVGREMIEKKSFVPLWQGKYWLDKPPLVMLIYGLIPKLLPFIQPEISARIFNLILNIFLLVIIYLSIIKITKSAVIAFFTVLLSSFTPLFIQRANMVNMDVFLALGWWGYFLFYPNFFLTTFFLSLAIFSKSLLGFYPLLIALLLEISENMAKNKKIGKFDFKFFLLKKNTLKIFFQVFIFSFWYGYMTYLFKNKFIFEHIYESHFKRVAASIEFHFGERLFYFFEISKQLNLFFYLSLIGFFLIFYFFIKRKITLKNFLNYNLFLPWFLFLNITKTKIYWYLYPLIPQFSFYFGFSTDFLGTKIKNIWWRRTFLILVFLIIGYWGIGKNNFLTSTYSAKDKYYQLAYFAKNNCSKIYFLPEESHRRSIKELEKMGLTITTTKWWGGHPALVYYTDNKIEFFYDQNLFLKKVGKKGANDCFAYFKDENFNFNENKLKLSKQFEDILIFK
ncbi:MAG: hypothetical protein QHH09_04740 [Microgenomates group bacterium]|nr:hypothetical protein [Microgenomates group bacterium]